MAESVTYADLKFVKAPLGNSMSFRSPEAVPAAEDDVELTYENIHLAQTVEVKSRQGAEQSKVHWWSTWYLPLSLLGACLFLLATTIGLGVRYWQVSQKFQQASRAHAAESSRLSQQVSAKEETLGQRASELEGAQGQLEQARQALEQMWLERNNTRELLQQKENELAGTQASLARVEEEMRETKVKLNQTETALSNIRPCGQKDCCPEDWLLYRGKCLFFSNQKKRWDESKRDCEWKCARLLIAKSWDQWPAPNFLRNTEVQYWIGLRRHQDEWKWIDDSPFPKTRMFKDERYKACGVMANGDIQNESCYYPVQKPWICEKAPSQPSPVMFPCSR